ncbi:hypothetical protein FE257_011136 [Aspergillus nanangensis]|uniref:C2H2-type domain-containing protein n=1 Tax=Aspergillus nanangensis TaxID=2582783 RepID=A0AAD4CHT7_ASPNN|nr:hypothetical protein FE257_011136 [Aspergillus nanangensis]
MDATTKTAETLNQAIDNASSHVIRSTLKKISRDLPDAFEMISNSLLVSEELVPGPDNSSIKDSAESEDSNDQDKPDKKCSKRLRERYAECPNCEQEFDTTTNTSKSCRFHPGVAQMDEDYFEDCYEERRIPSDSEETMKEYPEAYAWDCCKGEGDAAPCMTDWYREGVPAQKMRAS